MVEKEDDASRPGVKAGGGVLPPHEKASLCYTWPIALVCVKLSRNS